MTEIDQLRAKVTKLDSSSALIGFLSEQAGRETVVPLASLTCCCLMRNPKPRHYSAGVIQPAMLAAVPVIYDNVEGKVHIGGPGWFFTTTDDHKRSYTRKRDIDPVTKEERTRPVGILRDVFEDNPERNMFLADDRKLNKRLVQHANQLVSATPENSPGFAPCGDSCPSVPTLLSPITPLARSFMRLRRGPELEAQLIHCAETGEWGIPGLHTLSAPDNGTLKGLTDTSVELWVPLQGITEEELNAVCTDESEYRVEAGHQVFVINDPTAHVEAKIRAVFGVSVCPNYRPVVAPGQAIQVRAGRAMFAPLQRKHWDIKDLSDRADYEGLLYAAALHTVYEHNGIEMLDFAYAYNPAREPWVDLTSVPCIQKISLSHGRGHANSATSLSCRGAGFELDMLNISLRVEMRRRAGHPSAVEMGPEDDVVAPYQKKPVYSVE